jgi:hypothetical protein
MLRLPYKALPLAYYVNVADYELRSKVGLNHQPYAINWDAFSMGCSGSLCHRRDSLRREGYPVSLLVKVENTLSSQGPRCCRENPATATQVCMSVSKSTCRNRYLLRDGMSFLVKLFSISLFCLHRKYYRDLNANSSHLFFRLPSLWTTYRVYILSKILESPIPFPFLMLVSIYRITLFQFQSLQRCLRQLQRRTLVSTARIFLGSTAYSPLHNRLDHTRPRP